MHVVQTTQEANSALQAKLSEVLQARQALDDQLAEKETDFNKAIETHKAACQELSKVKSVCFKAMQVCSIRVLPQNAVQRDKRHKACLRCSTAYRAHSGLRNSCSLLLAWLGVLMHQSASCLFHTVLDSTWSDL